MSFAHTPPPSHLPHGLFASLLERKYSQKVEFLRLGSPSPRASCSAGVSPILPPAVPADFSRVDLGWTSPDARSVLCVCVKEKERRRAGVHMYTNLQMKWQHRRGKSYPQRVAGLSNCSAQAGESSGHRAQMSRERAGRVAN